MKLQTKFFLSFFAGFYFIFLLAFAAIYWTRIQEAHINRTNIFERAVSSINGFQRQEEKSLRVSLHALVKDFSKDDLSNAAKASLQNQKDRLGYDVWFVLDAKGKLLAASWDNDSWKPEGLEAKFKSWASNGEDLEDSGLVGIKDRIYRIVLNPVKGNSTVAWLGIGSQVSKESLGNIQQSIGLFPVYTFVSAAALRSISISLNLDDSLANSLFTLPESLEKTVQIAEKNTMPEAFLTTPSIPYGLLY